MQNPPNLVLHALYKLMKGKTTIIISHEPNLIRDADKIIVIKAGEIEQMGTHDELIRAGGFYTNLVNTEQGFGGEVNLEIPTAVLSPDAESATSPKTCFFFFSRCTIQVIHLFPS